MTALDYGFRLLIFLFFLLPPAPEAAFTPDPSPHHEWGTFEASLVQQACYRTRDVEDCLSRLHTECGPEEHRGPFSILHAAMNTTINEALRAIELVSRFTGIHGANYSSVMASVSLRSTGRRAFREQTALHDCIELLDLSVQELAWSVAEVEKMHGCPNDARRHGNVMAWMSAALGNQDTCLEGFGGTDGRLRDHIKGGVTEVTQLLTNVLGMYKRMHSLAPLSHLRNETETLGFPDWISSDESAAVSLDRRHRLRPDVVVALDGSGDFRSIKEAVNKAPDHSDKLYVIHVKKGVYKEIVEVKRKKTRIALVGDGMGKTVITGSRSVMQGWTTFRSATVAVTGLGFIASDMTFRNTAGPENHQAVALRVDSDCSAFYRCSIEGYQDTLYAHSSRQFYRDCNIYGTVDFIFGNGNIVIQHSQIIARQPLPSQKITITAQGRKSPESLTGFSIHKCSVLARSPTYLGRPWKEYSTTVFMQTYLDDHVQPEGWLEWNGSFALGTLFYGEYGNYGPGSPTAGRVEWPGHHILDRDTASRFTVRDFIKGEFWLPSTGVPYIPGLL